MIDRTANGPSSPSTVTRASEPSDASQARSRGASANPSIPDPVCSSDPVTAALALIARASEEMRDFMREVRDQRERAMLAQGRREVQAMRDKAHEIRTGALVSGSLAMGSAGLSMASAVRSADRPSAAALDRDATRARLGELSTPEREQAFAKLQRAEDEAARAAQQARVLDAGAQGLGGASQPLGRMWDARAESCAADAAEASNTRARLERDGARANDSVHAAEELLQRVYEAVRSVDEARHATERAILNISG